MRYLMLFVAVGSMILTSGAAQADHVEQLVKLLAKDGASSDLFGFSVGIDPNGAGTVIVGAVFDITEGEFFGPGSAYLFDSSGAQLFKLVASDGANDDLLGISVAIDGTIAIVGAPGDDDNGDFAGSAYLFSVSSGAQLVKLLPDGGADGDNFGTSVAISGNLALVGAPGRDSEGSDAGSAYLYDVSDPKKPILVTTLMANDAAPFDKFGTSVAIDGNIVIVGSPSDFTEGESGSGSVYIFELGKGISQSKLVANDAGSGDQFGASVAIKGTTAIVGAYADDDSGSASGSAYILDVSVPGQPTQTHKLLATDGAAGDQFGWTVAIDGDRAVVGAVFDGDDETQFGSAYLFDTATGNQLAKILPDDGAAFDQFGVSVAIKGSTIIVGSHQDDDNGEFSGSAYVFNSSGGINFGSPREFPALGEAIAEAVGSFDSIGNDSTDVAVIIPAPLPGAAGAVQVFLNEGNDGKTEDWIGLDDGELIPVGTDPSDITAGLFNADDFLDLAVSIAGDNQISVLLGDGNGSFTQGQLIDVGQAPSSLGSADFDEDGNIDLVVANSLDDNVSVYLGDGKGMFTLEETVETAGASPFDVDPGDIDTDKDVDLVGLNNAPLGAGPTTEGSVFVILNNGDGSFAPAVNYPVGNDPRQLVITDIDGDTFNDVAVVNAADATVSILLNQRNGTLGKAINFGVGTTPRSIDAVDLDGDGDPDLIIAADTAAMKPVVQVLANITSAFGEPVFELPLEFPVAADPNFVANGDFNADDLPDIVTANADDGPTGGSVTVLLNSVDESPAPPESCPWDLDGDGVVDKNDLVLLVQNFGQCDGECPADFDGNGFVDIADLLILLANVGECPGNTCVWDINGDGVVDIVDVRAVRNNMGRCEDPGNCPWDVNGDGIVDGDDVSDVANHFGKCP